MARTLSAGDDSIIFLAFSPPALNLKKKKEKRPYFSLFLSWYTLWGHLKSVYLLLLLGRVLSECWLDPIGCWCAEFLSISVDFLSSCSNSYWEGCWRFQHSWACTVPLPVLSAFALHILLPCCLVHIHLRSWHVLGWLTLCHYRILLSISGVFFALKSILYANKATCFLFIHVSVVYLFPSFYFQPNFTITGSIVYRIYLYICSFRVVFSLYGFPKTLLLSFFLCLDSFLSPFFESGSAVDNFSLFFVI